MALRVLEPGLLTTVQDLGRVGLERFGIPVGGAMDSYALRAANGLVGNPAHAAGLEITLIGPQLEATEISLIAVTGANLDLRVEGRKMPLWTAIYVRRGWTIGFGSRQTGCRAYLAVAGGIAVPEVMGSRSTYLRGRFGGYCGRALKAADALPVGESNCFFPEQAGRRVPRNAVPDYTDSPTLEVILGPQEHHFSERGLSTFLSREYAVDSISDRMGYRLVGPTIEHCGPADIVSDGIALGAVQVPADGQPMVMLADRPTTGGYTKIATVASADICLLAQCVPGRSRARFRATTVKAAQERYREMIHDLHQGLDLSQEECWAELGDGSGALCAKE